jgi:predicted metalloprotease with PDZ domain
MYIIGHTNVASDVRLDLPASWRIATGLDATPDPRVFRAARVDELVEGPIFAGRFSDWGFDIRGVRHRVVYWWKPNAVPFDSVGFVDGIRRLAEESVAMFGGVPWRDYTFIMQDGAYGGLEHANSVTLGTPSEMLARDPHALLPEIAHEFIHAWNLMRIRPVEYRTVDYRVQPPTAGLWFSEGLTLYYADALIRRAGLPAEDSTRIAHLESLLQWYLSNPGNHLLSAEAVSRAAYNAEPDALGDYTASSHTQGEVLGALLDLRIRGATDGRRSMDDVMRAMLARGTAGFTGRDIEQVVERVCECDVTPFFDAHVRGGGAPPDFNAFLRVVGLQATVTREPAKARDGTPSVDLGIWAWARAADSSLRIRISHPGNAWGRAGLRTGDKIVSLNGATPRSWPEFRRVMVGLRVGDSLRFEVDRGGERRVVNVRVAQLVTPVVRITSIEGAPDASRRLRASWR